MKKQIPNLITSFNLICGLISIYLSFQGLIHWAAAFMAFGAFFDFFDGLAARLLNAKSSMGLQMDSLADMVSFGVAPGFILFHLMGTSNNLPLISIGTTNAAVFAAFLIPVFSAYRLAKFNIDTRQTDSFLGLPTPAMALFVGSLPFVVSGYWSLQLDLANNYYLYLLVTIVLSLLMISEIPLFSLKFKSLKWRQNQSRFIFLLLSILLIGWLQVAAFPIIVLCYVLMSALNRFSK